MISFYISDGSCFLELPVMGYRGMTPISRLVAKFFIAVLNPYLQRQYPRLISLAWRFREFRSQERLVVSSIRFYLSDLPLDFIYRKMCLKIFSFLRRKPMPLICDTIFLPRYLLVKPRDFLMNERSFKLFGINLLLCRGNVSFLGCFLHTNTRFF